MSNLKKGDVFVIYTLAISVAFLIDERSAFRVLVGISNIVYALWLSDKLNEHTKMSAELSVYRELAAEREREKNGSKG